MSFTDIILNKERQYVSFIRIFYPFTKSRLKTKYENQNIDENMKTNNKYENQTSF